MVMRRIRPRRPCPPRAFGSHAVAVLLLVAAWVLLCLQPARAEVQPSDKEALLAFKAGLTSEGGELLSSWVPASDPCDDGWTGVKCSCDDFFAPEGTNNMSKVGGHAQAAAGRPNHAGGSAHDRCAAAPAGVHAAGVAGGWRACAAAQLWGPAYHAVEHADGHHHAGAGQPDL